MVDEFVVTFSRDDNGEWHVTVPVSHYRDFGAQARRVAADDSAKRKVDLPSEEVSVLPDKIPSIAVTTPVPTELTVSYNANTLEQS